MTTAGVCLDFKGQLAGAIFFNNAISQPKIKLVYDLFLNYQGLDPSLAKNTVIFYHPIQSDQEKIYDGRFYNHGIILRNSGTKILK